MPPSARSALSTLFPHAVGAQHWFRTPTGDTHLEHAGLATRVPPTPVTPRTTFHCFSTTKPITALAIVQLATRGHLSLDAPIATYLPDLPYGNGATVRQLLSHQAGLSNPLPLSWVHADEDHARFDSAAFLARVLREHPKCTAPGQRARYSNIGFLLLGRLVEIASGERSEDYIRAHVLSAVAPAAEGSADAYLDFAIPHDRHATGYTRRWSGLGLFISLLPDAPRLRTNEGGWIRYRPFHLDGAAYGGLKGNALGSAPLLGALATHDARLLPPDAYDTFYAPQPLASGKPSGHALSWFTGRLRNHDFLCHAGGGPGYGAEIRIYPSLGAASALLTNTTIVSDQRHLDRLDAAWLP